MESTDLRDIEKEIHRELGMLQGGGLRGAGALARDLQTNRSRHNPRLRPMRRLGIQIERHSYRSL